MRDVPSKATCETLFAKLLPSPAPLCPVGAAELNGPEGPGAAGAFRAVGGLETAICPHASGAQARCKSKFAERFHWVPTLLRRIKQRTEGQIEVL